MSDFNSGMNSILNGVQFVQQGIEQGRERKRDEGLRALAQQTISQGDYSPGALGAYAGMGGDPSKLQQVGEDVESQGRKQLGEFAGMLLGAPSPMRRQIYETKIVPFLDQHGLESAPWDEATILPLAQTLYQQFGQGKNATPAGLQEWNGITAPLSAEDRMEALRIKLGLNPRAAGGGMKFDENEGADGRKRPQRMNPQNGMVEVLGDYGWEPLGGGQPSQAPAPNGPPPESFGPMTRGQAMAKVQEIEAAGGKPIPPAQRLVMISQLMSQSGRMNTTDSRYASRTADEQASLTTAASEQAKIDAQVSNAPRIAAAEATTAAAKAKAEADAKAQAERDATVAKRSVGANDTLTLLDEAEKILPGATGSGAGSVIDAGAAYLGKSTPGAQATARLRVIGGLLTSKVPRMEGPQSNYDVELYRQMAGDLANDKLPVATRLAALQGIRALNEKYADQQQAPQGKQVKRTGTHNGRKVVEYTDGTVSYAD